MQSHVFGDLLNDMSNKVIKICLDNDLSPKLIDMDRYLNIEDKNITEQLT